MPSPAAIILAFANDWADDKRNLRSLLAESGAIANVLAPLVEGGRLAMPPPIHNATIDAVLGVFRARRYRDRVRVFHFGGHANASTLLFEDADGKPAKAHASGLASYLGQQRGLALVFLNGCSTEPQVRLLREAGVKAVVATTRAIQDEVAAEFATAFYTELASRSLREASCAAATIRAPSHAIWPTPRPRQRRRRRRGRGSSTAKLTTSHGRSARSVRGMVGWRGQASPPRRSRCCWRRRWC
jgi:CHAT domain